MVDFFYLQIELIKIKAWKKAFSSYEFGLELSVAIFWGLAAALALGVADFAAREAGKREGSLITLFYVQLIGSPIIFAMVFLFLDEPLSKLFSTITLIAIASGIQLTVGNLLFYQALIKGPLLIVAPVTSGFAIVTIFLSLLTGERLNSLQLIGICIALTGIILASVASKEVFHFEEVKDINGNKSKNSSGIALAIAAAILFGFSFWLMKFAVLRLGSLLTVLVLRQTALIVIILLFLVTKRSPHLISSGSVKYMLTIAVLDTSANLFINFGLLSGYTSVVSVITSLYSVVTIVLGFLLLRERINRVQQLAIGFTLAGVFLASL